MLNSDDVTKTIQTQRAGTPWQTPDIFVVTPRTMMTLTADLVAPMNVPRQSIKGTQSNSM
jgi:hypothetical protein